MTIRPINTLVANAVRQVNAYWVSAGQPSLQEELALLWRQLDADLDTARAAGDEVAAQRVIASYQARALAAIAEVSR